MLLIDVYIVCGAGGSYPSPCGRRIYDLSELYRCTHCDRPFHKACALRHFGMEHSDGDALKKQCERIALLDEVVAAAQVRVDEGHDSSCIAIVEDDAERLCSCGHTALKDALASLASPRRHAP